MVENISEKIELLRGQAANLTILNFLANINGRMDDCMESVGPSLVAEIQEFRERVLELKKRGVKVRYITEITKENLPYCKELMKIVTELRHLDGIRGNFAVSDREYIAMSDLHLKENKKTRQQPPIGQVIHSNINEIVEQQQYLFETLWNKAMPAEQRIKELEEGIPTEKTEVTQGLERTTAALLHFLDNSKERIDIAADFTWPTVAMGVDMYRNGIINARKRGVKIRVVIEITKDNLGYCKELIKIADVRHLEGIRGNFGVSESEYVAAGTLQANPLIPQAIYSNSKAIIEQQEFVFLSFWNRAIPAEQRINEIERGIRPSFTEIMYDPLRIREKFLGAIKSAKQEALLMLPTPNAVTREERTGILQKLVDAVSNGVKVSILMPSSDDLVATAGRLFLQGIKIHGIEHAFEIVSTILVIDREISLTIEVKDDSKLEFTDAILSATYSTSKATAMSYVAIFEALWSQADLLERLKVNDRMQKEFINIAAHELRTPVQPLLGMADLLESQKITADRDGAIQLDKEEIAVIVRNAKRLERLSSDILKVTRFESGSVNLEKERFSINELISSMLIDFQKEIEDQNLNIKLRYESEEAIYVNADKEKITEVLYNLVANAIKFTSLNKDKECLITVASNATNGNRFAKITVTDSGPGINPEILPRLFTKFTSSYEKGGTGLGLYISKSIVDAHGGMIEGRNKQDGNGAVFTFTIPLD